MNNRLKRHGSLLVHANSFNSSKILLCVVCGSCFLLLNIGNLFAGLNVDFNDNDGSISPTQAGFVSVTEAGATGIVTNVGTIDISLSGLAASNPDRDRGAINSSAFYADLGRDFLFGQMAGAPSLDVTLSGLNAGTYEFTGFFHDNAVNQGDMDVEFSVDGGSSFTQGLDSVSATFGTNPGEVANGTFELTANGTDDVVISVIYDGNGVDLHFLNGFRLVDLSVDPHVEINTDTGAVNLIGGNTGFTMNYYELTSPSGSLSKTNWNSLDQQNYHAVDGDDVGGIAGDSLLEGWDEAGQSADELLSEVFFLSSSTIGTGESVSLGNAFDTSKSIDDIRFEYFVDGVGSIELDIVAVTGSTENADFDGDGDVDGSDFLAWQVGFGVAGGQAQGDANGDGNVDAADFTIWQSQFGTSNGGGGLAGTTVPEPSGIALLLIAAIATTVWHHSNAKKSHGTN